MDHAEIYTDQLVKLANDVKSDLFLAEDLSTKAVSKMYQRKPDEAIELNQALFNINKKYGTLNIVTAPSKGTSVNIELNV
jgi:hypothetical protein